MKKKTPKRATKKSTGAHKAAAPAKRATTKSTPAAIDPIQAALARRRAAMIAH